MLVVCAKGRRTRSDEERRMLMMATLKRRVLVAFKNHPNLGSSGYLGAALLHNALPEPKLTPERLRLVVEELGREGALEFKPFKPAMHETEAYVVRMGERCNQWIEGHRTLAHTLQEILESLEMHAEESGKDTMMFGLLKKKLADVDESRLLRACRHLEEQGLVNLRNADNSIWQVTLTSDGHQRAHGIASKAKGDTYISGHQFHISGDQNALNVGSPGAQIHQDNSLTQQTLSLTEVAESLDSIIHGLNDLDFSPEVRELLRKYLVSASACIQEAEPDPKLAESLVGKALNSAAGYGESTTKLGVALTPLMIQLGMLAGQYMG